MTKKFVFKHAFDSFLLKLVLITIWPLRTKKLLSRGGLFEIYNMVPPPQYSAPLYPTSFLKLWKVAEALKHGKMWGSIRK